MILQRLVKRVAVVVCTSLLVLATGTAVSLLGIELCGGVIEWRRWLADNTGALRIWRFALYAAMAAVWVHIRRTHPLQSVQHQRLLRLEFTVVALLMLLELPPSGGTS
ncbi:hypothetical protein ACIPZ8_14695 [Pseudomonas sp. NPDC089422]|uniref:hypothetical protein n=1 Tax=Pseudomonas sp. NPDC089422 TaxID=3364466 RepID=UPI003812A288